MRAYARGERARHDALPCGSCGGRRLARKRSASSRAIGRRSAPAHDHPLGSLYVTDGIAEQAAILTPAQEYGVEHGRLDRPCHLGASARHQAKLRPPALRADRRSSDDSFRVFPRPRRLRGGRRQRVVRGPAPQVASCMPTGGAAPAAYLAGWRRRAGAYLVGVLASSRVLWVAIACEASEGAVRCSLIGSLQPGPSRRVPGCAPTGPAHVAPARRTWDGDHGRPRSSVQEGSSSSGAQPERCANFIYAALRRSGLGYRRLPGRN